MTPVIRHSADSQFYLLPFVIRAYLRDGHVEFVLNLFYHALYNLSLSLQGTILMQMKFNDHGTDNHLLQFRLYFFDLVNLEHVTRFNILKGLKPYAAFIPCLHLFYIPFETLKGGHLSIKNDYFIP